MGALDGAGLGLLTEAPSHVRRDHRVSPGFRIEDAGQGSRPGLARRVSVVLAAELFLLPAKKEVAHYCTGGAGNRPADAFSVMLEQACLPGVCKPGVGGFGFSKLISLLADKRHLGRCVGLKSMRLYQKLLQGRRGRFCDGVRPAGRVSFVLEVAIGFP